MIGKFCLKGVEVFNLESFEFCDKNFEKFLESIGGVIMFIL